MPIKPIDLQTLFMQLDQVGRARSAEKEGAILQQSIQAGVQQKKQVEKAESVKELDQSGPDESSDRIRDREGGKEEPGSGGERKPRDDKEAGTKAEADVVRDPDLGNAIDITG